MWKKENFFQIVYEGVKESSRRKAVLALRPFIEVDNKALTSVKLLDQHRVVTELVGPKFYRRSFTPGENVKTWTRGLRGHNRG